MNQSQRFLVLGAGAWGTALALHLAKLGHQVDLWGHSPSHLCALKKARENTRYLPGYQFPENLAAVADLKMALSSNPTMILIAVPSNGFEAIVQQLALLPLSSVQGVIIATKGLTDTGEPLYAVFSREISHIPVALLSGPSFAKEVAAGLPTAITLATASTALSAQLITALHDDAFRVYQSHDMIGVTLGGCLKNVLAIAVGIADGLALGANARAALITRGLSEVMRLSHTMAAEPSTLVGLAGLGDLVLTCTDNQSRNRRFGLLLGQGQTIDAAYTAIGQAVEGFHNAKQVIELAAKHQVVLPICEEVYAILYEQKSPADALSTLTHRPPTNEIFFG